MPSRMRRIVAVARCQASRIGQRAAEAGVRIGQLAGKDGVEAETIQRSQRGKQPSSRDGRLGVRADPFGADAITSERLILVQKEHANTPGTSHVSDLTSKPL